ncbi:glycosyltransferase family 4 protein [Effusibacillus lacus]|uniref:Group 1 glycosyl transferase n=1 Tax=Effusibacillus lacus TaxID=1348429 RepID=A0A292YS39_9BACL|nr:glycosyltransferase family 4 protein [Effusibacillus lacus]TCS73508.1 glycosyltransferase involved in cell wall biosynthesis [Effusibacillus lacus]GAX91996.1 group 1 glycosyl transferase [Effusibacillus lacus]
MKILLATYWYLPHVGGVSTYVYTLKRELEKMGHEVDIFAHHPDMQKYYMPNNGRYIDKPKIKDPIYEKMMTYYEQYLPQVDPWIRWRDIERYSFEAAAAVFGLKKYDLIHTQDLVSTRALWRVKSNDTPLIATIHGCLATEFIYSREIKSKNSLPWHYVSAEEYYGSTSSNITMVPTHWLKNLLSTDFNVPGSHLTVVPYGMDINAFFKKMNAKTAVNVPPDKKILVCPARLVPVKGHKHLLNALAKLKEERDDWLCWLIGDGRLRRKLEKQTISLNLQDHVIFMGNRQDVPALLKQADIFVLPSLQDNHPFSVMEAQVAGKAVVVSDAGGIPEMVTHKITGLISPAGESELLFQNLKRVIENDSLRCQLGENAQQWGMLQWSLDTMMERILTIYEKVTPNLRKGGIRGGRKKQTN